MAFSHWDAALTLDSNAGALTLLLLTVPAGGFNFGKRNQFTEERVSFCKRAQEKGYKHGCW